MARSLPSPFVVRPRRAVALMLPALVVALSVGCSHRRSSLRPVYVSPSTSAPCPSGDCGGATVPPSATSTPSSVDTSVIESGASGSDSSLPRSSLGSIPSFGPAPAAPAAPGRVSDSPPPVMGPGAASPEPDLKPVAPRDSSVVPPVRGSGSGNGGGASSPSASLKSGAGTTRRTAPGRVRSASLHDEVSQYTNDPDDLFQPPKADRPWKFIVLHHSANPTGGYNTIDQEHRKRLGWQGCGYHFVIGNGTESPDGRIEVAQRWVNQKNGVHCRDGKTPDVNEYGIGICLVGDLEKAPPTDRQVAAARALVAYLSDRYHVSPDHTETHAHLASSNTTTCPGRLFPTEAILGSKGLTLR